MNAVARKKPTPPTEPVDAPALFIPEQLLSPEAVPEKPEPEPPGLVCRECGCRDLRVWRTTRLKNGTVRRERYCRNCGTKKITFEREAFQGGQ